MNLEIKANRDPLPIEEAKRLFKEIGELALLPLTVLLFPNRFGTGVRNAGKSDIEVRPDP